MKYLSFLVLLLGFNTCSKDAKIIEHWDDKYNSSNYEEIEKSKRFLKSHNLQALKVFNEKEGIVRRHTDSLPFIYIRRHDTLIYYIPGGLWPTTREDFKTNFLNKDNNRPYFIEGIRKDGRIAVRDFRVYKFVHNEGKLYHLVSSSRLSNENLQMLYDKVFNAKSEKEKTEIIKEINRYHFYKSYLIFDFTRQKKVGDRINIKSNRYSELLEVIRINDIECFKFKSNIFVYDMIDQVFIIDKSFNFYEIEGHGIRK